MLLAITTYTVVTAIHVIFAVSFLGTAGAFGVIGPMARDNPQHAVFALKVNKKIYETAVLPGVAGIWLTGIYQWADGGWGSSDVWLMLSVVWYAVLSLVGIFVLYPGIKSVLAEMEAKTEPGPPSPESQAKLKLMGTLGPIFGISMIAITFLMVAKPF